MKKEPWQGSFFHACCKNAKESIFRRFFRKMLPPVDKPQLRWYYFTKPL